ncbi:MAG: hypothetical protein GY856_02635 [bacterium]|nr:hypothetical protein [bacterium]
MGCHHEDHNASQKACEKKFDQFYDVTGTVPPCEICDGPTGPIPCGNLAADPVLDSDGPLHLAVINDQPLDNSLVWAIHNLAKGRELGRVNGACARDQSRRATQGKPRPRSCWERRLPAGPGDEVPLKTRSVHARAKAG